MMTTEAPRGLLVAMVTVLSLSTFNDAEEVHQENVHGTESVSSLLYMIDLLSWRNIVILYTSDTEDIMFQLFHVMENSRNITVFLTTGNHKSFSETDEFLQIVFHKYLLEDLNIILLSGDLNYVSSTDIIVRGTSDTMLNIKSKWLLFTTCSNTSLLDVVYLNSIINVTNVAHVFPNPHNGPPAIVKTVDKGHFRTITGNLSSEKIFPNIPYKLNGKSINIGVIPNGSPHEDSLIELLDIASGHLNFTYKLVAPLDGEYGHYSNGTWSGIIGQLFRHEVDLGLAAISVTQERIEAVDFILPPLATGKVGVIYKKEKLKESSWFLFWAPFQKAVYGYIFLSYVIVSFLVLCLARGETREPVVERVTSTFLLVLGYLFLEGSHFMFRGLPIRFLLTTWLLFCVAMGAIYTGQLTRSLIPGEVKSFNNLQELINKPNWKIGILGGSSDIDTFASSENADIKIFWTTILKRSKDDPSILSSSFQFHMKKVLMGQYAFVVLESERIIKMRNDCLLDMNEDIFDLPGTHLSMATPTDSHFKLDLDIFILKLRTTGILEVIMAPRDNQPAACHIVEDAVKPLYIDNIKGAFGILGIGFCISALILIAEMLVNSYRLCSPHKQ